MGWFAARWVGGRSGAWPCLRLDLGLPTPLRVTGRAGDLLLTHYLLGHNIGGNFESTQTRRALYYRISSAGHASRRVEFLQDAWLDYTPVRSAVPRAG